MGRAAWLAVMSDVSQASSCADVRLLPLETCVLPFVFAEALSKLKYTIFSWEWNCIFKCSSGLIKQSGRNTVDCCTHLKTEEQSPLFQTGYMEQRLER